MYLKVLEDRRNMKIQVEYSGVATAIPLFTPWHFGGWSQGMISDVREQSIELSPFDSGCFTSTSGSTSQLHL